MTIAECFGIARDIIVSGAALVTAWVAVPGLHRWKRELLGKENLEAARNLLRATYKIREAVGSCRDPYLEDKEFPEDYDGREENPMEDALAYAYVYRNRWRRVRRARQEFNAAALEAEVLWGCDVRAKAKELRVCLQKLFWGFQQYVLNVKSDNRKFERDKKLAEKVEWIIGETVKYNEELNASEDWFEKYGGDIITGIENLVRPHLNPK